MLVIRWLALPLLYSVLESTNVQCLRVTNSASRNVSISRFRSSSRSGNQDNGIKLITRPRGEYKFNSVTSLFIRARRQASTDGTRMGKVWMLTEGTRTEVETVASWDVAEDANSDDEEFKLTTDRLAYILIGSCCVLSIVCLLLVLIGLKCHRKCTEKKNKKLGSGYLIYPTANCYRIRSYSDAHFYQVPVYNEEPPYPASLSCMYCKGYPYYYKGWNSQKELNRNSKRTKYQETKKTAKSNIASNSALHEQTLDIRGRKTVKRITVLPPTETEEPKERKRRDSKEDNTPRERSSVGKEDNPWIYSRRSSKSKKEIRLNTLTDNERDAWLNCIYLLDELHRCHASSPHLESTDMSTLRHASTINKSRRSSQGEQEKSTHAQRVFFSEPSLVSH